ncbi:FtsH protease activity modulator HflK [Rhizobium sp. AN80A]|uniref:FtsH protease activity modulator HflK n=1 Tax=Rhizobium sp. AN80A TaxID=3040673 RepID=UPI0024B34FA0|nr:FtsH protease activity modulator HflK [Rhizobium sp. AN80A]
MNRKERTIFLTILINGLLVLLKFWLASASGSLSLRSSALHSLTDVAISVFVLVGLFISRREVKAGRRSGTVENWTAIAISVAIFYVGLDIVRDVLNDAPVELRNITTITLASMLTVVITYVVARYKLYVGRQTNSPALTASGYHSQIDIYASIVVVTGLAGAALGLPNLDKAAAAIVAVMIFLSGYQVAASAITALRQHRRVDIEGEAGHSHMPQRGWWRAYGPIVGVLLVMIYMLSGFYVILPGEKAVVRRFGQVVEQNDPGLHYRLPAPLERVDIVAVDQVRRMVMPQMQMLSGDENLVSVRASLHFVVSDPVAFVLNVANPADLVMQAGTATLRQVVASEAVDLLLTLDKAAIENRTAEAMQIVLDRNRSGLRIVGVQLLESAPPPEVAEAFRDVASAREDRNTFVNEALAYRNEVVPLARGEGNKTIQAAAAYTASRTAAATGETASFLSRQAAYAAAPDITRQRLYLEAAEKALAGAYKLILDPRVSPETTDLWLGRPAGMQPFPPAP